MEYGLIAAIAAAIGALITANLDKILLVISGKKTKQKTEKRKQSEKELSKQDKKLKQEKEEYEKMLRDFDARIGKLREQLRKRTSRDS